MSAGGTVAANKFSVPVRPVTSDFGLPIHKRSWTQSELVALFPGDPVDVLDVGAGQYPLRAREGDRTITLDFDASSNPDIVTDFSQNWPVGPESVDFVYMSHVIEHLYPQDRDRLIRNVFGSMRTGALLFIRVPHWSSIQGTGWEHYTMYGTNGVTSLTHGKNPNLPRLDLISAGVWMGGLSQFTTQRSFLQSLSESVLNTSFRLTDCYLCYAVGGIPEVQFLLRKP